MEDTAGVYAEAITQAPDVWTSALAAFEAILVLSRHEKLNMSFSATKQIVSGLLSVEIDLREPASAHEILVHAIRVAEHYGVGKRKLSSFDCFHYAYAKTTQGSMLASDALRATDLITLPPSV